MAVGIPNSRPNGEPPTPPLTRRSPRLFAISLLTSLLLVGCTTNDFRVVEALQTGMTRTEARATIETYSFPRSQALNRPPSGWPKTDNTFTDLPGRAFQVEQELHTVVASADYYPVGHGLLGAGQLFLFYDAKNKLIRFYRHQIN